MNSELNFVSCGSQSIAHYQIGEGPPLIILHGWGSSARVMMPLAHQLRTLRCCHLIDLPGFGNSPEPAEAWSVGKYADLVDAFIDSLNVDTVDLLVHSYGGRIALKLLVRPESARRIRKVLITGGAGIKPKRNAGYYARRSVATLLKAPGRVMTHAMRDRYLKRLRESSLWRKLGSSDYSTLSGVMRETFVRSVNEHLDSLLPKIEHEVLLLWGREDDSTPLYQGQQMERELKRAALVVIDGAGHYAFLDKPKQFAAIAEAYFRDVP